MHRDVGPAAVTASQDVEEDLALRALVDVSADGLAVLDGDGDFAAVNEAAARILGVPAAELLGRAGPFTVAPDRRRKAPERQAVSWCDPEGRRRDLEYRVAPVPGTGYAVWFSDVTDRRRQQERLTAIVRAASSVADAGALRATLDAVAQEIVQTANIAAVQILVVDNPRDMLRVLGMAGFGDATGFVERLQACRRLGARVRFLEALERGEAVVVPDRKAAVMANPAWAPLHGIMGYPTWDSFVAMPMVVRGRSVGVINAYYAPGDDPGPNSLAFLGAMADHAAVAIDAASLLSQTRSRAQVEERQRLARELHDSVVQQLFSMRMQARALRSELDRADSDPTGLYRGAEELAEFAQSALADLRRLVFELHPLDLGERGLVDAVRAEAASIQARTGLAVTVHAAEDLVMRCDIEAQEDLYRIVQEALHNVVKHAGAAAADIRFATAEDGGGGLLVEVSDNGHGAEGAAGAAGPHGHTLGLVSMRERAERWGGWMTAGPRPGGGWTVRVTVPWEHHAAPRGVTADD